MNTVYSNANSLVDQEEKEKKELAEEIKTEVAEAKPEEKPAEEAPKKKSKKQKEVIVRLPNEAVANVETLSDAEFKAQYKERIAKDKEELKALLAKYSQEVSQEITAETKERNVRYAKTILLSSAIKGKNADQIATKAIKSLTDAAKHGSILDAEKLKSVISRNTSFCEAIDENGAISGTNEYNQEISTALDANYNEFVAKASETEIEAKDSIKVSDVIAKYSEQLDIAAHFELGAETYQAIKRVKTDLNRVIPTNGPIDPSNGKEIICSLKNVDITFGKFKAVKDASFDIYKGETFSLVGESGSGKTTIGRAVIRINGVSNGEITYKGMKISGKISRKADREVVRNIQMVFQDPAASLNERATVEYIVGEGIDNFHLYDSKEERMQKIEGIIKEVGLLPEHLTRYPHEFSGGQRQRIGLARSIVMEPELVIADEPISALDVSIRAQVLNLLKKFQKDYGITYLFVAHDLSIVRFISDRIAVIYKGTIVEIAESEELFNFPLHPYTKSLLSAIPVPDPQIEKNKKLYVYNPDMHDYSTDKPSMRKIAEGHFVYCNNKEFDEYKKIRG
ncbi:MAG: ATP-binding cassette domain-containing protein [Acholeplasmatales bacterium]|nr:ATP-binding cassette domain-containing protein [Acholeplasmatales bacterium]